MTPCSLPLPGYCFLCRAALTSGRTTGNGIYCPPKLQAALDMQSGIFLCLIPAPIVPGVCVVEVREFLLGGFVRGVRTTAR